MRWKAGVDIFELLNGSKMNINRELVMKSSDVEPPAIYTKEVFGKVGNIDIPKISLGCDQVDRHEAQDDEIEMAATVLWSLKNDNQLSHIDQQLCLRRK